METFHSFIVHHSRHIHFLHAAFDPETRMTNPVELEAAAEAAAEAEGCRPGAPVFSGQGRLQEQLALTWR
jgi:hypothetical protein